jgi:hypothetical protein
MKLITKNLLAAATVASLVTLGAQANPITGSIWENFPSVTGNENGSLANAAIMMGNRAADITFSVNSPLTFDSRTAGNGYTIGGFLATGGASGITYGGGTASGDSLDNTLFYFAGVVSMVSGQTFTVTHDDGLQLMIGGVLVVDVPGPTAPDITTYTWTGATGNYDFELAYAEVDGPPGVLETSLPFQSAPDGGSTMALLGGALTMMGVVGRRFRK